MLYCYYCYYYYYYYFDTNSNVVYTSLHALTVVNSPTLSVCNSVIDHIISSSLLIFVSNTLCCHDFIPNVTLSSTLFLIILIISMQNLELFLSLMLTKANYSIRCTVMITFTPLVIIMLCSTFVISFHLSYSPWVTFFDAIAQLMSGQKLPDSSQISTFN